MNRVEVIQEFNSGLEQEYKAFVETQQDSMMYHTIEYKTLLNKLLNAKDHYLISRGSDSLINGVLPMVYRENNLGKVLNSLPFYGSNGAILTKDQNVFNDLLNFYNNMVSDSGIASSTIITNPLTEFNDYSKCRHSVEDYRIGQFTRIGFGSDHAENLMQIFHYKTRNMVRKAMKSEIDIEIDNSQIDFLYDTHLHNMKAIGGKAKIKLFFDLFPTVYKPGVDYNIYIAKHKGEKIAALLLFYHKKTVEYYTPVIVEAFRDKQPLSLLIYESMVSASQKGFELWNWGGTWASQGGVYTFKKRWGTEDINYFYYTQINNEKIYQASKEQLLTEYSDFFVIPFNKLINA